MPRYYDGFFESGPAKRVDGGIKAQSKRGRFGATWWSKRWLDTLEHFELGGRLERGRAYARQGQVVSIAIASGEVTAVVQGSSPTPYKVSIQIKTLGESEWTAVIASLEERAVFVAKLLAGEMPTDIEDAFKDAGIALFPERLKDIKTACTCPDSSNPCKHIAAVYYLIGEEFDRDPFLIFELRGMSRDELRARLLASTDDTAPQAEPARAPLTADVDDYWHGGSFTDPVGDLTMPASPALIVKRLGGVPFWRGAAPLFETVAPIYSAASTAALDVALGLSSLEDTADDDPG